MKATGGECRHDGCVADVTDVTAGLTCIGSKQPRSCVLNSLRRVCDSREGRHPVDGRALRRLDVVEQRLPVVGHEHLDVGQHRAVKVGKVRRLALAKLGQVLGLRHRRAVTSGPTSRQPTIANA